jgi:hypothetical protein
MTVGLQCALSDANLDSQQGASQRQLSISIQALMGGMMKGLP